MPVIIISGQPVCGSSTLAGIIAKKLGLRHFSLGKEMKKLAKGRETEKATKGFSTKKGGSTKFHHNLDEMQRNVAQRGNVVIDSKLGIHMLEDIADFTIWLKAPKNVRARRVAKRDKINLKESMKSLEKREKTERRFFRKIYGFDTFSQEKKAGLVLDTANKTPQQLAAIAIKEMKKRKVI